MIYDGAAVAAGDDTGSICERISPLGFCTVWTLAYASLSFIILMRSGIRLPANNPSKLSAIILPCTSVLLPFNLPVGEVGELNSVTIIGPFSPALPLCIWAIVTLSILLRVILYDNFI